MTHRGTTIYIREIGRMVRGTFRLKIYLAILETPNTRLLNSRPTSEERRLSSGRTIQGIAIQATTISITVFTVARPSDILRCRDHRAIPALWIGASKVGAQDS